MKTIKYKSGLESKFAKQYNLPYESASSKLKYITSHTYNPDWVLANNLYLETKGRWIASDRSKLKSVLEQNPGVEVVMVFQNPSSKLNKNSKTSYSDWCTKHNVKWFKFGSQELTDFINNHKHQ